VNDHTPNKTLSTLRAGNPMLSIMPQSLDDVARMAKMAVMAGLVIPPPKKWKPKDEEDDGQQQPSGNAEEALLAQATMIILQGLEVGLPPMQALQTIAIINGRCLIWGDAVPALLWSRGFKIKEWFTGEEDSPVWTAHCQITRPDGEEIHRTFSKKQAVRARLWDERAMVRRGWGKDAKEKPNDSPWFRFPDRMLAMRARGFCSRDGAPDVMRGMYVREEIENNDMVDVSPAAQIEGPGEDIPEMPDPSVDVVIPDITDVPEMPDPESQAAPEEEPTIDVGAFLVQFREDLAAAKKDKAKRLAVWEKHAETIGQLSEEDADLAEKIYDGRAK
jgi:hypothetical protein